MVETVGASSVLPVDERPDDGLLVVHPAQLAGHDGPTQGLLGQVAVLPLEQTLRVLVFLKEEPISRIYRFSVDVLLSLYLFRPLFRLG